DGAVDRIDAFLGSCFRNARCRIKSRGHARRTGVGSREADEVGTFRLGPSNVIYSVGDVLFGLLDRVGDRLHDSNAECHALLRRRFGPQLYEMNWAGTAVKRAPGRPRPVPARA